MNDLKQLIEKSRKNPALAPVYALELDRQLRGMGQAPFTFSANGVAGAAASTVKALDMGCLFEAQSGGPTHTGVNIHQAEILIKEGKRSDAIAHAFTNAQGPEVNALNLFYANHAITTPKLRLYFLNKYLSAFGLDIELEQGGGIDFFHQIKCARIPEKVDGPLVTVIVPVHNSERTIELAVGSLLNQTWQNLQIIVVNDASTDGTLQKAKDLAKRDPRVEVLSSPVNVGPYVCRNLGVLHTRGQWLTVHDADDWAFPDRIQQQVQALTDANAMACTGRMLRMNEQGQITRPISGASTSEDGYLRLCFVSLIVQTAYFRNELGAWDSVRVGGDAELIERLKALGAPVKHLRSPLMLCLDHEAGLTNHQTFGLSNESGQFQNLRADYKQSFTSWHKAAGPKRISMFGKGRPFQAPRGNLVEQDAVNRVFAAWAKNLKLIKDSDLFDAAWYKSQYPEFEKTGLEVAEHYLTYGAYDQLQPSPKFDNQFYLELSRKKNPLIYAINRQYEKVVDNRVLISALKIAESGDYQRAITLIDTHLPTELKYTAHAIKANAALSKNDESEWQMHLNAYLLHFKCPPICLESGEGTLFDRLDAARPPPVKKGPLITVVMPAWNAEKTVLKAARSILNQTWRNLELLIVDDASTDRTWDILQDIAKLDLRVRIFRNKINVGPYVSKNIALMKAQGEWFTGHDADDWAQPKRLEDHLRESQNRGLFASLTYMVRITSDGQFSHISQKGNFTIDGVARKASISCLFNRNLLVEKLGFWDSVRFGADSEMIYRAEKLLGNKFGVVNQIGMICQDLETSLTNHSLHGVDKSKGISPIRANYRDAWMELLQSTSGAESYYLPFPQRYRRYAAASEMVVSPQDVEINLAG